jgi:hypothetical protein
MPGAAAVHRRAGTAPCRRQPSRAPPPPPAVRRILANRSHGPHLRGPRMAPAAGRRRRDGRPAALPTTRRGRWCTRQASPTGEPGAANPARRTARDTLFATCPLRRRSKRRLWVGGVQAPSAHGRPRRVAAPHPAVDDLPQRGLRRRRDRVLLPAPQDRPPGPAACSSPPPPSPTPTAATCPRAATSPSPPRGSCSSASSRGSAGLGPPPGAIGTREMQCVDGSTCWAATSGGPRPGRRARRSP